MFPVMEDVGIDEAFLDLSSAGTTAQDIAHEIKRQILKTTGLTSSIGIAPNKLLAKICSDLQKPDGLTILTETDIGRVIGRCRSGNSGALGRRQRKRCMASASRR